jgi:hypothetical protein
MRALGTSRSLACVPDWPSSRDDQTMWLRSPLEVRCAASLST